MDKFKSRLAKRQSRPMVKTDYNRALLVDWWSIEVVDWVNYSQAYKCIDMPLSFYIIVNVVQLLQQA